jgi:hypothetical protein
MSKTQSITAILNCYRRPQNLAPQIKALLAQSVQPQEIWIWKNYHPDQEHFDWGSFSKFAQEAGIRIIDSNYNWKYCGPTITGNIVVALLWLVWWTRILLRSLTMIQYREKNGLKTASTHSTEQKVCMEV